MPPVELLGEAERMMRICNACRYCEGFCAVFPALERRRVFEDCDLIYLANLCHDCRDCYYACQYAPPHEFDLNIPKIFQELRVATYKDFVWPGFFAGLFQRNGLAVTLITVVVTLIVIMTVSFQGVSAVFSSHLGEGAFYAVIPWRLIVLPTSLIVLWGLVVILLGVIRFWRTTGGINGRRINARVFMGATWDMLMLRYLKGGGYGCNFPDERFSHARRRLHHLVFYGFLFCISATAAAMVYEHFFHRVAPYPFWSLPVMLGTFGGAALLVGSGGLFWYKRQSDPAPANPHLHGLDFGFLALLFLTSFTGMILLILRGTFAMGFLLAVHFGLVLSLFITLPYGKFVHATYRYTALVQNAMEQSGEEK